MLDNAFHTHPSILKNTHHIIRFIRNCHSSINYMMYLCLCHTYSPKMRERQEKETKDLPGIVINYLCCILLCVTSQESKCNKWLLSCGFVSWCLILIFWYNVVVVDVLVIVNETMMMMKGMKEEWCRQIDDCEVDLSIILSWNFLGIHHTSIHTVASYLLNDETCSE